MSEGERDDDRMQFADEEQAARLVDRTRRRSAAIDRDSAAGQRDMAAAGRDESQAESDRGTAARSQAAHVRERAASARDASASDRDQLQSESDQRSWDGGDDLQQPRPDRGQAQADLDERISNRGHATQDREHAALDRELTASDRGQFHIEANERSSGRGQSADDRERAAADREDAEDDRIAADRDLASTQAELRVAQLDDLTGALGRVVGMRLVEQEIIRARRGNGELVLAYIDVDALKETNDRYGHAAGDLLLREVVDAIQAHLRPYDPLIRVGGDEFVCALGDCTPAVARLRFRSIRARLALIQPVASISIGLAELRPEDTLEALTRRGDLALYEAKRSRQPPKRAR